MFPVKMQKAEMIIAQSGEKDVAILFVLYAGNY